MPSKGRSTNSKGRAETEPPSSPGPQREAPDDEDDLEQMVPVDEAPEEPDVKKKKKNSSAKSSGKSKKKDGSAADDSDDRVVEEEEMVVVKKVSSKKRSKPSEVEAQQENEEVEAGQGDEDEEAEGEQQEINMDKIKRDRRGAKRTGYRQLAEQCGYDPKGQCFKTDMQASAMSELDVKRLVSFVPTNGQGMSLDELERRMEIYGDSLPKSAARQALCHIEHAARHVIQQAVEKTMRNGTQTVTPVVMEEVLEPYRGSMEFSSIAPPVGLVRHAKSTPAQYRKEVDSHGKAKLVASKETIIHPYEPNTDDKLRKDDVLSEYKETDKKMKAAETRVAKKCAEYYAKRVAEVEAEKEQKAAKRHKKAAAA